MAKRKKEDHEESSMSDLPFKLTSLVEYHAEDCCFAAMVVKVNEDGTANLHVFSESGECGSGRGKTNVSFSADFPAPAGFFSLPGA